MDTLATESQKPQRNRIHENSMDFIGKSPSEKSGRLLSLAKTINKLNLYEAYCTLAAVLK